jgi:serine/threonine protein kinase/tetratricopeptide (TPR) repeat protein
MDAQRWQEVQVSFDALIELDAVERGNRLTALGNTDPELRAAVERLLAADAKADSQLAALEDVFVPQSAPTPDPLGLTGRTISHFHVGEPVGAGGMGVVYRAEDSHLGRTVALKFLHPSHSFDEVAKARFLREAHSAASLDHPNLCAIHEVGTSDDGQLFLAMPLYAGETLKTRLAREGPMRLGDVLEIAQQIAAGLERAHAAGIVHRDLKPGNVMLLPDGTVKILDFGLAKARDQSLTESGMLLGTVSYMAPEQIRGETVDGRADLWALSVVLYEMLTKRTPFDKGQDIAVAHAILHDEPVPPSTHRGDVSPALEDLVLRLLEKDPARRYATATEVLSDLAKLRMATARAWDSTRRRLRRVSRTISRSKRGMLTAGAAILLIGAGGLAVIVRNGATSAEGPARTAIAVLPFQNLSAADSSAYLADGLQDEILTQLHKIPALKVIGRTSVMSYSGPKTPPLRQIANELGVGAIVDGSTQVVGNRVRVNVRLMDPLRDTPLWVERYDRTLDDIFAIQSDIARQIVATVGAALSGDGHSVLAQVPTAKSEAYLLYLQGKEYERRPGILRDNIEAAARLYEQAIALDSGFALAHAALSGTHAWTYISRWDMTPARLALQRAEAETALRLAPNLPEAHDAMAAVHNVGPNYDIQAAIKESRLGTRSGRGLAFYRQAGDWEEYRKEFQKAVELDPRNVNLLTDYGGDTHIRMGRFADAIRWYDRAASLLPDTLGIALTKAWIQAAWKGQMGPIRAWMNGEGGRTFRRNGWIYPHINFLYVERQPDSLLQLLKQAREPVFQSAFQFEPVALWSAAAHELRGDYGAAHAAYDSALVIADSAIRKYSQDFPVHVARGMALAGLGRRAEALEEVPIIRDNYLYEHVWVRDFMLLGIAQIHAKLGDATAAVDNLEEILSQRETGLTIHNLRMDPAYDRIRRHPRFQRLLIKYANHPNQRS